MTMNGELIRRDRDLTWIYAATETAPPDHLRMPVTIAMIARRLNMSEDVVGRRLGQYVRRGWIQRVRKGYLYAMVQQQSAEFRHAQHLTIQRFFQLVQALRQLGVDPVTVKVG
jgi:DNA-binding Lrp family transcriptional regulator